MSTKKIDALYLQGKEHEDSFAFYYANLRPYLWKYARAIGHQSMNHIEDHLVDEMVDDLLMDLGSFQGHSKLSTWAYVRFRRRCIGEYRYGRKNLGDSLDSLKEDWSDSRDAQQVSASGGNNGDGRDPYEKSEEASQETGVIVEEFKQSLSERRLKILEDRLLGYTFKEIGHRAGVTGTRAHEIWTQILEAAKQYGQGGLT